VWCERMTVEALGVKGVRCEEVLGVWRRAREERRESEVMPASRSWAERGRSMARTVHLHGPHTH